LGSRSPQRHVPDALIEDVRAQVWLIGWRYHRIDETKPVSWLLVRAHPVLLACTVVSRLLPTGAGRV
jgi:hypothetical protein